MQFAISGRSRCQKEILLQKDRIVSKFGLNIIFSVVKLFIAVK